MLYIEFIQIITVIIAAIIGIFAGYFIRKNIGEGKINSAEKLAETILENAHRDADALKKEMLLAQK